MKTTFLVFAWAVTATAGFADSVQFSNPQPIVASGASASAATPYASTIAVSGLENRVIGKVIVSLHDLSHTFPDDLDVLLVGPQGQSVILMSDAGLDVAVEGVTLTFDDAARAALPDTEGLSSGVYRPGNSGPFLDVFAPPAPAAPYGSSLGVFNGTDPNGTWSLYVMDDTPEDGGVVAGGWSVSIELRTTTPGLESGTYQTVAGTTVVESGDRVPNGSRVVPFSATVTLDMSVTPPSLTAVIDNAVLEGGEPFPLTVRSSSVFLMPDGNYRFSGDYLADIRPEGSQYLFGWTFSPTNKGEVVWNGLTGWAGGHAWYVGITNVVLASRPRLEISQTGSQVTLTWPTTDMGYQLEQTVNLPAPAWIDVTNAVAINGNRFSVTVEASGEQRYFRLRRN